MKGYLELQAMPTLPRGVAQSEQMSGLKAVGSCNPTCRIQAVQGFLLQA